MIVVDGTVSTGCAQTVTRHGKDAVVVVSAGAFKRSSAAADRRSQSLAEFLLHSPLRDSKLRIRRSRDSGRLVRFGR